MLKVRDILENNYDYYLLFRELGHKAVEIKGFKHISEMNKFTFENKENIVVLERLKYVHRT